MSTSDRALRRGDQVAKKRDPAQKGRVEGNGPMRGTVIVFFKEGILKGREMPVYEDELDLLAQAKPLRDQLEWLGQAMLAFRCQVDRDRPFTEVELCQADVAFFEGLTPEEFIASLTKE